MRGISSLLVIRSKQNCCCHGKETEKEIIYLSKPKKDDGIEDVSHLTGLSNLIEISELNGSTAYLQTTSSKLQAKTSTDVCPKYILLPEQIPPHKVHT